MSISLTGIAGGDFFRSFGIADLSGDTFTTKVSIDFAVSPANDSIESPGAVDESASDGSALNAYVQDPNQPSDPTKFIVPLSLPFEFADGTGIDQFAVQFTKEFFGLHVGTTLTFDIDLKSFTPSGQFDGGAMAEVRVELTPFPASEVQADYLGIQRHGVDNNIASGWASDFDQSKQTEADLVNDLLKSNQNTSIPAVAVEGSMYDHVGTSKEVDNLVNNFLPAQIETAATNGFDEKVYACEVLGLAFAAADENGGTAFAISYGPSNASMLNTPDGDAAFASAASMKIFGSAANAHTPDAIAGFVANWKAFYTSFGIPGILNPTSDQVDLYARGAAWGDAVGVALANNLGQLPQATINFLEDAAHGTAIYSASLGAQPTPAPFEGGTPSASAASEVQLTGIPADAQHIGM